MNEHRDPPRNEDIDTGEPIAELASLRESPSPAFLHKVRNSIHRRVFAADIIVFSVMAFFQTFFDYFKLAIQAAGGESKPEGKDL